MPQRQSEINDRGVAAELEDRTPRAVGPETAGLAGRSWTLRGSFSFEDVIAVDRGRRSRAVAPTPRPPSLALRPEWSRQCGEAPSDPPIAARRDARPGHGVRWAAPIRNHLPATPPAKRRHRRAPVRSGQMTGWHFCAGGCRPRPKSERSRDYRFGWVVPTTRLVLVCPHAGSWRAAGASRRAVRGAHGAHAGIGGGAARVHTGRRRTPHAPLHFHFIPHAKPS